MDGGL